MNTVLVPLADGVEEMEAVILVDVLRRAHMEVITASLHGNPVTASRGIRIVPDKLWQDISPNSFDVLAIPGGAEGVNNLSKDTRVLDAVCAFDSANKWIAAVCAGPLVLQKAGILKGRRVTCHPGVADQLTATPRLTDRVVVDGRLVTSQGPGTSFEFALTLVRLIMGPDKALSLGKAMILP
jgi:4-methyl-5(b-hydroxyethyl)-thiazole monophosphate biosynthesis